MIYRRDSVRDFPGLARWPYGLKLVILLLFMLVREDFLSPKRSRSFYSARSGIFRFFFVFDQVGLPFGPCCRVPCLFALSRLIMRFIIFPPRRHSHLCGSVGATLTGNSQLNLSPPVTLALPQERLSPPNGWLASGRVVHSWPYHSG